MYEDMKEQEISYRKPWLARAALIAGIAGIIEVYIRGLFYVEGGLSRYAWLPAFAIVIVYCFPLVAGLVISRKRPLLGGIVLLLIAVIILVSVMVTYFGKASVNPVTELLTYAGQVFSWIGLPYLVTGILFILSARQHTTYRQQAL
jgi:hypothetical protein